MVGGYGSPQGDYCGSDRLLILARYRRHEIQKASRFVQKNRGADGLSDQTI
jgi:hypothetical protein